MIPTALRILVCTHPVDMRRSFDGLAALVVEQLDEDPTSDSALFVFINAKRSRAKILWRDASGFCLLYKRLDARVFAVPEVEDGVGAISIDAGALAALLDGVTPAPPPPSTERDVARAARLAAKEQLSSRIPQL